MLGGGELALLFDGACNHSPPPFWNPACGAETAVGHLPCAVSIEVRGVDLLLRDLVAWWGKRSVCERINA